MFNPLKEKFAFTSLKISNPNVKIKFLMGFSLVELMVIILISLVILMAIYALYSQGTLCWYTTDTNIEVTENARKAMATMIEELSNSANSQCSISTVFSTDDEITFRLPSINDVGSISWGNQISYFRGGTSNKQLIRTETGQPDRVLCNNLEDSDIDGNGIIGIRFYRTTTAFGTTIAITLQTRKTSVKGNVLTATLTSRAKLRNQ